ncbi:class I SAM-dependent methyltransferase [Mycobacterium hubeiense]|uniref:class I SAM-dependent methyltransferase n=1 Tax=Mycobacterium hubeiense TaxID=1867256 RepID=UPI000C7F77C8|nr:methyltransferase domain-containing protein [Mycobacterium sp. QGD 101]
MTRPETRCRACGDGQLTQVLDLGAVPAADCFPPADQPVRPDEASHPLAMLLCAGCGLAQLAQDDTASSEPRGVEPQALKDQAVEAVNCVQQWLSGSTVREFGSPHGGSWLPLLAQQGFTATTDPADVVVDCFGIMHEPDQRAAIRERAAATAPTGVLLLQYHALSTIVAQQQWNALRHGHFAYYSMPALVRLLTAVGMSVATSWSFDLYGGTVLLAAVHGHIEPDAAVRQILTADAPVLRPEFVGSLQHAADAHTRLLRSWLEAQRCAGRRVYAYGAASRAVALFARAGLDSALVARIADASPAKHGRRMPGTDIPIISPDALVDAEPDVVLLTVPDLLPEVTSRLPTLAGRWVDVDRLPQQ